MHPSGWVGCVQGKPQEKGWLCNLTDSKSSLDGKNAVAKANGSSRISLSYVCRCKKETPDCSSLTHSPCRWQAQTRVFFNFEAHTSNNHSPFIENSPDVIHTCMDALRRPTCNVSLIDDKHMGQRTYTSNLDHNVHNLPPVAEMAKPKFFGASKTNVCSLLLEASLRKPEPMHQRVAERQPCVTPPPCQVLVPGPKVQKHGVPVFGQARVSARHVLRNTSCRHSPTLTLPT